MCSLPANCCRSAGKPLKTDIFGRQYLWNVFSHNSAVLPSGYNEEENKMIVETSKIFETDSIGVTATCVRVPVLRTHCESVNIEFQVFAFCFFSSNLKG